MKAFHDKLEIKNNLESHIEQALKEGTLTTDCRTGTVYTRRGPMKCLSARGYIVGTVHLNGVRKQVKAHQAVWIAIFGPIPKGKIIDHINRDKADNRLLNLRLTSQTENSNNRRSYCGESNPAAKISKRIALSIREKYKTCRSYRKLAVEFQISATLVAKIIRGELWA